MILLVFCLAFRLFNLAAACTKTVQPATLVSSSSYDKQCTNIPELSKCYPQQGKCCVSSFQLPLNAYYRFATNARAIGDSNYRPVRYNQESAFFLELRTSSKPKIFCRPVFKDCSFTVFFKKYFGPITTHFYINLASDLVLIYLLTHIRVFPSN